MTNNEFQGNPESGIDRFLNESAQAEQAKPTYEELEAQLASARSSLNFWQERYQVAQSIIDKAENWITDTIAGSIDRDQAVEDYKELAEILGVELEREVEIEITVSWRGTVTLPFGVEVSDLDIDDFGIDQPEHNEYESDFRYHGIHYSDIQEY